MTQSAIGLTDSHIMVGNSSNLGADVAMSGDVTIDDTGATTIKDDVALGGSPTTTTQTAGDNSTKIATTAYVDNAVPGGGTVVYNAISGNLPSSMSGSSTTASMSVSAGQAADSTNTAYITGAGYSWAVSNGNAINGYQSGTTLPNSSTIHMFLCTGASGTGTFASTSLTPTLPTGYDVSYRRIFSFNTNSSGAPIPYKALEAEGGSLICYLTTQVLDISTTTQGTTQTLYTLTVPTGVKVNPIMRFAGASSGSRGVIVTSGDETNVAPTGYDGTTAPLWDLAGISVALSDQLYLTTNTSGQIGARGSASGCIFHATTRGFKDFRRG